MYPPGIPIVVRGEILSSKCIDLLNQLHRILSNSAITEEDKDNDSILLGEGCTVTGSASPTLATIRVIKNANHDTKPSN